MSGLGGCGYMVILDAEAGRCHAVDFGAVAPRALDPADYPLADDAGTDDDLFGWPRVVGDRNVRGPLSIAAPTQIAGLSAALERFGALSWAEAIGPAVDMARRGMKLDWYATLRIALEARGLADDPVARDFFTPGGLPAASPDPANPTTLRCEAQIAALERLRDAGPDDFYRGDLARTIAADMARVGARVNADDLAACEARIVETAAADYRGATVHVAPGPNAGPTLLDALARLEASWSPAGDAPDAAAYRAYADALFAAWERRLATMGETGGAGCTTHITAVDAKGGMAALTQTLLSVFGSRVMLPEAGFLANNGIMWFDPRPGGPNGMRPGGRPLSNMCPAIATGAAGGDVALGASGGRRILPAVFQLVSFLADFPMTLDEAFHTPRLDVSGSDIVTVDARMDPEIRAALSNRWRTVELPPSLISPFACPNAVRDEGRERRGAAFVASPWAGVAAG